ncbi:MAG: DUF971 domain-containing protein [Planctomycetota bacterium]
MSDGELPIEGGRVLRPVHLDLDRERALTVQWSDGRVSIYPVRYLRKMSPSAEARQLREELAKNPLTVLPSSDGGDGGQPLRAESVELVGHYAVRIRFTDGHDTGIYSWAYLREIDPNRPENLPDSGLKTSE